MAAVTARSTDRPSVGYLPKRDRSAAPAQTDGPLLASTGAVNHAPVVTRLSFAADGRGFRPRDPVGHQGQPPGMPSDTPARVAGSPLEEICRRSRPRRSSATAVAIHWLAIPYPPWPARAAATLIETGSFSGHVALVIASSPPPLRGAEQDSGDAGRRRSSSSAAASISATSA